MSLAQACPSFPTSLMRRFLPRLGAICALATLVMLSTPAAGADRDDGLDTSDMPRNTWGEIGILDMPSARVAPDGQLTATVGLMENTQRYNFDFQVTPWFEAIFRYGHISGAGGFVDYHRNLGFKIRLFNETDYFPVVTLGARDIIGTGRQGAEYLVATKNIFNVDVTAGVGWGRLADNDTFPNPFALLFPSFKNRNPAPLTGGTLAYQQLFHGEKVGVFGGLDWRTPVDGLDLLVEYSSDHYTSEVQEGVMKYRSPVNVGVSYNVFSTVRIMAGWFYGSSYGATVTFSKNPNITQPVRIGPALPPPHIRSDRQQMSALTALLDPHAGTLSTKAARQLALDQTFLGEGRGVENAELDGHTLLITASYYEDPSAQCRNYAQLAHSSGAEADSVALTDPDDPTGAVSMCAVEPASDVRLIGASDAPGPAESVERTIRDDVAAQNLQIDALDIQSSELWIYYRNTRYLNEPEAAGRIIRILMKDAPPGVEIFHLVLVEHGEAIREFRVTRSAMERVEVSPDRTPQLGEAVALELPPLNQPVLENAMSEPHFTWSIAPALRESFFDPTSPIQVQVLVALNGDLEVAQGVDLVGEFDVNVYNNFDLNQVSTSQLPHVRSDAALYYRHGINGIGDFEADYRRRLAPDVYSVFRAGYLEDMFAGAGYQVLWRPEGQRFSIGADIYQVWQRDFDRLFGVQRYNVLTGHVTVYYNSPWYGLNFNVHVGRYLAGDYGGTIEITRKFVTGVEIGAFATFTNVPFSKFGEGSFDKGFILRIPFEWPLPYYTQSGHDTILHSLARDGGQRLANDDSLYEETRSASYGEITSHLGDFTNP